jgi:ATP-dependent protease ClpP protease subunit
MLLDKGGTSELYLYDIIGSAFGGISAQDVIQQLKAAKGTSLDIHILSEGGDVFEAKGIYNAIAQFKGKKTCYVDGLAASAATFVMMAGDTVLAAPGSTFMTHGVWTTAMGNAGDMRRMADQLELETKAIAGIYAKRTGKTDEDMMNLLADETWFDCKQAIEMKFIDGEYELPQAQAKTETQKIAVKSSPIELMRMRSRLAVKNNG